MAVASIDGLVNSIHPKTAKMPSFNMYVTVNKDIYIVGVNLDEITV